jgi:tetratricopeptide (TPR) repeat protein
LEDYASVISDANYVIETEPLYAGLAYSLRGQARLGEGDTLAALGDYERALEHDPSLVAVYVSRGELYYWMGESENALDDAEQAIELAPDDFGGYMLRAMVRAGEGDYSGVIRDAGQVIELAPEHALAYDYRGWAYANQGKYNIALHDMNKAAELEPELWDVYADRYWIYEELGRYDDAIADLETLITLTDDMDRILAIEEEIARLSQGELSLTLQDLPLGFVEYPPEELGLDLLDLSEMVILSSFAFVDSENFEMIWGFVSEFPDQESQDAFDAARDDFPEMVSLGLNISLGATDIEASALPGLADLGDASTAATAVIEDEDGSFRVDALLFRQDDLMVSLYILYLDGEVPVMPLDEIAPILEERLQTFLADE